MAFYLALPGLTGCSKDHDPAKLKGDNVLFITLDTTRADRIGCYGYKKAQTPTLDSLAARGTMFEQAYTQAPLTCPSHCTMMTGLYPREHGVRDNGAEKLGEYPTLARLFKQNGYRTGGFVAAFVLDDQFGIGQGFDEYNDDMGGRRTWVNPLEAQQPGNVITDRALAWLKSSKDKPFFCWVHYYDPHDPYAPPPDFAAPDRDPYDGEISFMDSQIKRLIDWLTAEGLLNDTLIVAVGDHGESFDEHGEKGHTNYTYETNLHVPLILAHPDVIPSGKRIGATVELVDLYPTMLDLFGWELPRALMSRSLVGAFRGEDLEDREIYSETLYLFHSYEWAEQRSLTTRRWKYISSTKPELYDRQADPGEMKNLALDEPRIASDMYDLLRSRWDSMVPGTAERADLPPEALAKLQSLGYLGGGASDPKAEQFLTPGLPDPKDKNQVIKLDVVARVALEEAHTLAEYRRILPLLRDLWQMAPNSSRFMFMYARALLQSQQPQDAIAVLDQAIDKEGIQKSQIFHLRAGALRQLGQTEQAIRDYEAAIALDPQSALIREGYAGVLAEVGRTAEALEQAHKAVELDPKSGVGYARLCAILTDPQELSKVVEDFAKVVGNTRDDAPSRWKLAQALGRLGRSDEALAQMKKAAELDPELAPIQMGLAGLHLERKEYEEAKAVFHRVAGMPGHEAKGLYHIGVVWSRQGDNQKAAEFYRQALEKDPAYPQALMELTVYYRSQGRLDESIRILGRAVEVAPESPLPMSALGQILATTANEKLRDCPRAVELLEKASQLAGGQDALILANLAAGYACIGRFDLAIQTVEQALQLGDPAQQERLEQQLRLHQNSQPYVDDRLK
jgi:arylsulfatase A-like enzyme/tetratricopeptide (TPR) repeat protein